MQQFIKSNGRFELRVESIKDANGNIAVDDGSLTKRWKKSLRPTI